MITNLADWTPRERPTNAAMHGRYVDVVPWDRLSHGAALWEEFGGGQTNELLYHFGWPVMETWRDLADILDGFNESGEFVTCIFSGKGTGEPLGMANYMSFAEADGRVETGAIAHGPRLARSRAATEGHYLMACRVFDELKYRRYEWKLNNPNEASHRAARRFGFTFEGVFRQHMVKPYGNRDTAWYSMIDREWPSRKRAFQAWLDPSNFDNDGHQIQRLEDMRDIDDGKA